MPVIAQIIGDAVQTTNKMIFEWRIPYFFSLSGNVNTQYASPVFTFADSNWCLSLFPYGHDKEQSFPGWVSIYLKRMCCLGSSRRNVYFTLGIQTFDGVKKKYGIDIEHSTERNAEMVGIRFFWLRSELWDKRSTLLPSSTLTIVCDLSSSRRADHGVEAGGLKVAKSLLSMLTCPEDCDVIIKVENREIPAHRAILRARSTVFRDMLSCDVLKRQSNVVTIKDFDFQTIVYVLVYIYKGCCRMSMKNVYSLYMAADRYNLDELKAECAKYMKKNITVDSFCDIITLAVKHDDKELLEYAKYFFCQNSVDISKIAEWQTFRKKNLTVAYDFLSKQCLYAFIK